MNIPAYRASITSPVSPTGFLVTGSRIHVSTSKKYNGGKRRPSENRLLNSIRLIRSSFSFEQITARLHMSTGSQLIAHKLNEKPHLRRCTPKQNHSRGCLGLPSRPTQDHPPFLHLALAPSACLSAGDNS